MLIKYFSSKRLINNTADMIVFVLQVTDKENIGQVISYLFDTPETRLSDIMLEVKKYHYIM